jgi:dihydrofolate reductase
MRSGEDEPPYHSPVVVLTHHAHEPIEMEGGTTLHFVTDGPEAALERARQVAGSRDISRRSMSRARRGSCTSASSAGSEQQGRMANNNGRIE